MSRVLIELKTGPVDFALYKDGMFEVGKAAYHPIAIRYWAYISDMKKALNWK